MKHGIARGLAGLAAVALLASAAGTATAGKKKTPKDTYLIETSHEEAACMAAMDEIMAAQKNKKKTPMMLEKTMWGCMSGDHRGWTTVQAATAEEAIAMIPESLRGGAKAVKVTKITPKMVKDAKKKAMEQKPMEQKPADEKPM